MTSLHERLMTEQSRNVTKHACICKEGCPTNRFSWKQLLNFCASASEKCLTNSRVSIDINRLTPNGYEISSNVKRVAPFFFHGVPE